MQSRIDFEGRSRNYEEVLFWEDSKAAEDRLKCLLHITHAYIMSYKEGAVMPIICTIPPAHIATWNYTRYDQHKTCTLHHTDKYEIWQENLKQSIIKINASITTLNNNYNLHTPKLADNVLHKKGKHKGYKLIEKALVDGVHATEDTRESWAVKIMDAISRNRAAGIPKEPSLCVALPPHNAGMLVTVPVNTDLSMTGPLTVTLVDSDSESEQRRPHKRLRLA